MISICTSIFAKYDVLYCGYIQSYHVKSHIGERADYQYATGRLISWSVSFCVFYRTGEESMGYIVHYTSSYIPHTPQRPPVPHRSPYPCTQSTSSAVKCLIRF